MLAVDRDGDLHSALPVGGTLGGAAKRTPGEHVGQVALVVHGAAAVGYRGSVLRGQASSFGEEFLRGLLVPQQLFRAGCVDRRRPAALSATPASAILPASIQRAAETATIAQSPALRSTFSWALPPPGRRGRRISVRIWPSWIAVT